MSDALYAEKSWNPLANAVQLSGETLRIGLKQVPLAQLNLAAMADAYQRGQWLGAAGTLRPLDELPSGAGIVPITRFTGSARPLKVREARAFADALGQLAVRHGGGPQAIAAAAARAEQERVPLWMARRLAHTPAGPVAVAVDRRLVRADVWLPGAPDVQALRLRGPRGLAADRPHPCSGITVLVGGGGTRSDEARLSSDLTWRKSKRSLTLHSRYGIWRLTRRNATSSELARGGRRIAVLEQPHPGAFRAAGRDALAPLTRISFDSSDPLDAVAAHFFGVCFGIGDQTGKVRFGARRTDEDGYGDDWALPWPTRLGRDRDDGGSSADTHDGGTGSDSGDSGGGDSGGDGGGGGD